MGKCTAVTTLTAEWGFSIVGDRRFLSTHPHLYLFFWLLGLLKSVTVDTFHESLSHPNLPKECACPRYCLIMLRKDYRTELELRYRVQLPRRDASCSDGQHETKVERAAPARAALKHMRY